MPWLRIGKVIWAAPCSLLGLAFSVVPLMLGGSARLSAGVLEVTYRQSLAACGKLALQVPFRGIVFGHVILAVTQEELLHLSRHERVHVEQYERWGPVFFVAYGLSSLWELLHGRSPYWHNHFEVQARHLAGQVHRTHGGA